MNTSYAELINEDLSQAHYVSFYDHPDKYIPPSLGGNKLISSSGIDDTGLFLTHHSHRTFTNSTTCTFAAKAKTNTEDMPVWKQFCPADHPYDFHAFVAFGARGRKLVTSIPGKSSHKDTAHISPFFKQSLTL